jgi:23S rRNA (adenine-N6)-dimethyltransferase
VPGSAGSRRAWGWHPLTAEWARLVVEASPVRAGDLVLDLGAGAGALTDPLLEAGARVVAVELHHQRTALLRTKYDGRPVRVVRGDLVDLRLPRRPFRVVASPPYQLSSRVVQLLLATDRLLSADLVLQRAAACRLVARGPHGRHGRRYLMELGMKLPRRAFSPPPQVDSVVLQIRRR